MNKFPRFFPPVAYAIFSALVVVVLLVANNVHAAPLIEDPAFLQLDTSDGLAQDTVRDIVRDNDGFIWIATEGGVSRWDGYRFVNLDGPDGVFVNSVITNLYVDTANRLWVSTYTSGIFYYDLENSDYRQVVKLPYFNQADWVQAADGFEELSNGDMAIALDQAVLRYSHSTGKYTELFRLSDEELTNEEVVRDIKRIGEQLLVATSSRLYALSLKDNGKTRKTLDFLPEDANTLLTRNAKALFQFSESTLFVGTVGGLFSIDMDDFIALPGEVIKVKAELIVDTRNIWSIERGTQNEIWLGTDRGLYRLSRENESWKAVHVLKPSYGMLELADKSIRTLLPDEQGNLWLGSAYGGLLFWYSKPLSIETYQNTVRNSEPVIADNIVWSFLQQGEVLWVGTENGLTKFSLTDEQSEHYLQQVGGEDSDEPTPVNSIFPGGEDTLVLETYQGLQQFSISRGELLDMPQSSALAKSVFNDWNFGSAIDELGRIYFIAHGFYRYDPKTKMVEELTFSDDRLNPMSGHTFLDADPYYPGKIFLSMREAIYQIDIHDLSVTEVYRFPEGMRFQQNIVTSFAVDGQKNLWIGLPSAGIVGLDADNFVFKKHLTVENRLYTDIIYNLTYDNTGSIWFSSHGYFGRYQPLNDSVERFRYGMDIKVSEFNNGAGIRLEDNRIVLGSTSGFIIFDPVALSAERTVRRQNVRKMVISGVTLDSRAINRPMHNLSGEHVNFHHDDFGITIQFAALSSSYSPDTQFRYKLVRDNAIVNESVSKDGSVTFAFLSPGEYHFDVSPLKQSQDALLLPASLSFTIPYPPLRSPVAYGAYFFLLLILLGSYFYHRQRQLKRLHHAQRQVRLFGDAFQHTRDWVMIFDSAFTPVAVNPSCCAVFGIESSKSLQPQLNRMFENSPRLGEKIREKVVSLTAGEFWKSEERLTGLDGRHYDVLLEISVTGNSDKADHFLIIMSDISEQKNAERKLIKIANYDSLTGLVNRQLLLEKLEVAIDKASHQKQEVGVLFVDLDRFKGINDSLGHDYGDKLLRVVANRMLNLASDDDTVARLGGDEFVIVMENVSDKDKVSRFVDRLIESVETPIALGKEVVRVSASVGISFYPNDAIEPAELLKQSDVAMYSAKKENLSGFSYFTEEMNARVRERLVLENRVKKAYQEGLFYNHYQPIINVEAGKTVGVELLLRCSLNDPPLAPSQFISVLEELRYIIDVTRGAMKRAINDLKQWYADGFDGYVAINLSAMHFKVVFDVEGVVALLEEAGLPRHALRFELTEGILMDDAEGALRQVNRFIEAGFILALDDFGTGYSSLSYLKKFPLQVLKIDKSFVDDIDPQNDNDTLVLATIDMAASLNMRCVAEGVENKQQVAYLREKGCIYHQGYYYSKPVDARYVPALITRQW